MPGRSLTAPKILPNPNYYMKALKSFGYYQNKYLKGEGPKIHRTKNERQAQGNTERNPGPPKKMSDLRTRKKHRTRQINKKPRPL
jgi:hypothetical protein